MRVPAGGRVGEEGVDALSVAPRRLAHVTKRKSKHRPPGVEALLEASRRNEAGTPPRKHHLVPASYLRRWAEDGKVRVTVVDEHRTYVTSPGTAARQTDFYRIEHPAVDPYEMPPLLFETILSRVEETAHNVIDQLLEHRDVTKLDSENLYEFAWHLALSITRGRAFRAEQQAIANDFYKLQYSRVTDEGIRALLEERGIDPSPQEVATNRQFFDDLQSGEVWVQPPLASSIAMSAQMAEPLAERLLQRRWLVFDAPPILVTCDEPVVIVGGPGWPRSERSGAQTAGVLMYPLGPSSLLVLFHPEMRPTGPPLLDRIEVAEVNKELIAASSQWVFERPSRRTAMGLRVPLQPEQPLAREGPLPQAAEAGGELYRWMKPTRWSDEAVAPPWPVHRWWIDWQAQQFPRLVDLPPEATVEISDEARRSAVRGHRRRSGTR